MRMPPPHVLWGVLLLLSSPALADSRLHGVLNDAASKAPLAEVMVTATSPQLQDERIVMTDARGAYSLPQLPPGLYTLRFDKEGFRSSSREGIPLRLDRAVRVNVELLSEGVVTESSPFSMTLRAGSIGCTGGLGGDYVERVAVMHPRGMTDPVRPFVSMARWIPLRASRGVGFGSWGGPLMDMEAVYFVLDASFPATDHAFWMYSPRVANPYTDIPELGYPPERVFLAPPPR